MSALHWDEESGHFLSAEHQRIAQVIHDYDPSLELAWIPPDNRALNEEYPFAVLHKPEGFPPYVVMRLRENEVDHRVISRLWANDAKNGNVLDAIEKDEQARQALALLEREEAEAEARELAAFMVKSPVGAKVKIGNKKLRLT